MGLNMSKNPWLLTPRMSCEWHSPMSTRAVPVHLSMQSARLRNLLSCPESQMPCRQ